MATYDVKLGLTDITSEATAEKGENHVTMCTGLAWLTLPAGFLTGLSAECANLRVLDQEVLFFGGKVKFEAKRTSERKVKSIIKELGGYVTAQADGPKPEYLEYHRTCLPKAGRGVREGLSNSMIPDRVPCHIFAIHES